MIFLIYVTNIVLMGLAVSLGCFFFLKVATLNLCENIWWLIFTSNIICESLLNVEYFFFFFFLDGLILCIYMVRSLFINVTC